MPTPEKVLTPQGVPTPPEALSPEAVRGHPRFRAARDAHVAALVALFSGDRFVTWMMADAAVIVLRGLVVALHASHDPGDRGTWGTAGHLHRLMSGLGIASPRRVDGMIARFRQARYVEARPAPTDRRIRLLAPTPRLLGHDRDHLAAYHRFLLELFPGHGYEWIQSVPSAAHPEAGAWAHLAVRRAGLRRLPQATAFRRHAPMMLFLARDAGYLAFLLLAHAQIAGRAHDLSFAGMAAELGVSRTHVRNLFREAEAAGYVRLGGGGTGPAEITPPLWDSYERFLADVQVGQHAIAQAAFGRPIEDA